jgi:hypothetical protein
MFYLRDKDFNKFVTGLLVTIISLVIISVVYLVIEAHNELKVLMPDLQ